MLIEITIGEVLNLVAPWLMNADRETTTIGISNGTMEIQNLVQFQADPTPLDSEARNSTVDVR